MNALVAVSMGDKYNRQTERMIDNFVQHNPDWDACWYFDDGLTDILPRECKKWSPFNRCEIGRWCAMRETLKTYDNIVYCDGDMRWYAPYEISERGMTLYPHYVTDSAKKKAMHRLWVDGVANIGIMEMTKCSDNATVFDFIIGEVLYDTPRYMHGEQLWLQNIVSMLPNIGLDVGYNSNAGYNVARWNLMRKDRSVFKRDGKYMVRTADGIECPLVSFHFSEKSIDTLYKYGEVVEELKNAYLRG